MKTQEHFMSLVFGSRVIIRCIRKYFLVFLISDVVLDAQLSESFPNVVVPRGVPFINGRP